MDAMVAEPFLTAFDGARVLVTGHTGFKGSWLTFLLSRVGATVLGYALAPPQSDNHFDALRLDREIEHVEGDIRDAERLASTMERFQPEFVFHLAAQGLVRKSFADPITTFETNVIGSVNLLEAVRRTPSVRSLVYITSDKCYENLEWVWGYRENDRLGGHDPYSASKAAAEIVFSSYARSFFGQRPQLGAASTRAGNVIGGGDWAEDRIVPDCMRAIRHGEPIVLRNPGATRPWQHVLEPLSGYLLLATRLRNQPDAFAGPWNFGPPSTDARNVLQVAEGIVERFGRGEIKVTLDPSGRHEAGLLQLNCDKANHLLPWNARWDIDKTLSMTVSWYQAFFEGTNMADVTWQQCKEYFPEWQ
jgi:CDP-glucose 4,6-dehydratase